MKALWFLSIILWIALVHGRINRDHDHHWEQFKKSFNKDFPDSKEEHKRRVIWNENLKRINKHNTEADLGKHSYKLGVNEFADMTREEFNAKFTGLNLPENINSSPVNLGVFHSNLPKKVDWRKKGYVTPVKNQGACGSCWSFSTTGSIEGQNFKKTEELVSLSEQQLVDCSRSNSGCAGGWMDRAFSDIIKIGGIMTEEEYNYSPVQGRCRFNKSEVAVRLSGFKDVEKSEEALKEATATIGPISIAVDASEFHLYKSGIFSDDNCNRAFPNHAILVVGYGSENGKDFWIVKNSWGTSWGENGYIRLHRNADNMCGVANFATYPIIAQDDSNE